MELPEGSANTYDHLKSVSYAERSRIPLKYNDPSMREVSWCLRHFHVKKFKPEPFV